MINPWLQFLISAAIIVFAGSKLTKSAAVVAENTGIGTAWAGALMLPLATSLPEMVTTLRSVVIDAPDMAMGNLLGSCLFNLALLGVIDFLHRRGALTAHVGRGHIITASLGLVSVCLASIAILRLSLLPVGWIGFETLCIAIVYLVGSRLLYKYERRNAGIVSSGGSLPDGCKNESTLRAALQFIFAALFIVLAGVLVTDASDRIALQTGLGHTFVGSLFLAVSTSLPETVTTITAVRLGYLDMAVANVFGANFMNLFIVFPADLLYRSGPLLDAVSEVHLLSALMVILFSVVIIFGINYRSKRTFFRLGYDTLLVLVGYFVAVYLIFRAGGAS